MTIPYDSTYLGDGSPLTPYGLNNCAAAQGLDAHRLHLAKSPQERLDLLRAELSVSFNHFFDRPTRDHYKYVYHRMEEYQAAWIHAKSEK